MVFQRDPTHPLLLLLVLLLLLLLLLWVLILCDMLMNQTSTRAGRLISFRSRTERFRCSFLPSAVRLYNSRVWTCGTEQLHVEGPSWGSSDSVNALSSVLDWLWMEWLLYWLFANLACSLSIWHMCSLNLSPCLSLNCNCVFIICMCVVGVQVRGVYLFSFRDCTFI
jgi:hypothetical protein